MGFLTEAINRIINANQLRGKAHAGFIFIWTLSLFLPRGRRLPNERTSVDLNVCLLETLVNRVILEPSQKMASLTLLHVIFRIVCLQRVFFLNDTHNPANPSSVT